MLPPCVTRGVTCHHIHRAPVRISGPRLEGANFVQQQTHARRNHCRLVVSAEYVLPRYYIVVHVYVLEYVLEYLYVHVSVYLALALAGSENGHQKTRNTKTFVITI